MSSAKRIVPKRPRSRLVRDAIHGDIQISALEAAVIDTRVFQRLRYIRQNGLLHFIFPGAVHTRFAHSIGTMAVAGQVLTRLADVLEPDSHGGLEYVASVFRLAALLHDVGHCAFSHSSERVRLDDQALFGTLRERLTDWKQSRLIAQMDVAFPRRLDQQAMHEELGLALVYHLFQKPNVDELCQQELQASAETVATDIRALMNGGLHFPPVPIISETTSLLRSV